MMETWLPLGDRLHRLPNGAWIRLADVRVISPHQFQEKAEVAINLVGGPTLSAVFETLDEAVTYADELAALVNEIK